MIKLTRTDIKNDVYTHTESSQTSLAWNRVLNIMCDDIINLKDDSLSNKVYDVISDLQTSAKQDVLELMKDEHIASMFLIEY
jgi:hypothetical protein